MTKNEAERLALDTLRALDTGGERAHLYAEWVQAGLLLTVERMYHVDSFVSFGALSKLSEALGTRLINLGARDYSPGCDTCDFGSQASAEIWVSWPPGEGPS